MIRINFKINNFFIFYFVIQAFGPHALRYDAGHILGVQELPFPRRQAGGGQKHSGAPEGGRDGGHRGNDLERVFLAIFLRKVQNIFNYVYTSEIVV